MTVPVSRLAYQAEYELLDQAIGAERGMIRIFPGYEARGEAMQFRTRLHYARTIDRRDSRTIYPPDDDRHGQTPYAQLIVRLPVWDAGRNAWVLKIEKPNVSDMLVEEIPPPVEQSA